MSSTETQLSGYKALLLFAPDYLNCSFLFNGSIVKTSGLMLKSISLLILISLMSGCDSGGSNTMFFDAKLSKLGEIEFSSPAFKTGDLIPTKFTCYGDDLFPPLRWSDVPGNSRSIAIIMDDTYLSNKIVRHWSIYNIPIATLSLKPALLSRQQIENTFMQAENDFEHYGYTGPCPPTGEEHEYVFFIYALSQPLDLSGKSGPTQLTNAMQGYVIAYGSFSGRYVGN
tara:strand:- start:493 stop:1173 length:681 start_codon:yes stop_codon:yes gene_type:complete